jgi:hypothetical protein
MTLAGAKIGAGYLHSRYSITEHLVEGELFGLFDSQIFSESP